MESINHIGLKKRCAEIFSSRGYKVYAECAIGNRKIDLICHKGHRIILVECVVSQRIGEVYKKLMAYEGCNRYIYRFYKNKSPLARKIIQRIKDSSIKFVELK